MKKFKIVSRKTIINSPYCPIEKQIVELPNGEKNKWYINTNKGAVIVIPILQSGEILLQKSYKHGCGEIITEFCAGMIEKNESPETTVERELLEETGYKSKKITKIGEVFSNPTGAQMKYHFFIAKGCKLVAEQTLDDAEQIELFTVSNLKAVRKLFTDPKTLTSSASLSALCFAENILKK